MIYSQTPISSHIQEIHYSGKWCSSKVEFFAKVEGLQIFGKKSFLAEKARIGLAFAQGMIYLKKSQSYRKR